MTIQTELVGDPVEISTIVDFRGRVLKRWTHPLTFEPDDTRLTASVREWHVEHEQDVRESLTKVVRKRHRLPPIELVLSRMYLAGMSAYAKRDFVAAEAAWRACSRLLPEDRRIQAALARIST